MSDAIVGSIGYGLAGDDRWEDRSTRERGDFEVQGAAGSLMVAVLTRGRVSDDDIDYAVDRVSTVLRRVHEPILFARLKLGLAGDPARPRPALAQTTVDVNGDLVRAHVAGHTMSEALDLLQRRLADKLEQRSQHRDALRSRAAGRAPGEWRHGDRPDERPDYYDRPPEERRLIRHRTFAIDELTVDEAAFDMEQLDYGFYLFRDVVSGEDALIERTDDGGYRLTRLHPAAVVEGPTSIALTVADTEPPVLAVAEAIQRLDTDAEPFVFFASAATGRGNVVYRRYDGHYGLIVPADGS
ncbi:MAG TPA: sigma 54 modulation/S30EA ribosomal C-terminal domain-containing protein [Acidimicrobiales bacterium]|nr:sigma 54 modulation/S30EA ribosomal C-terminal domain-containing protein [Acidimicrobiales bacterium]